MGQGKSPTTTRQLDPAALFLPTAIFVFMFIHVHLLSGWHSRGILWLLDAESRR